MNPKGVDYQSKPAIFCPFEKVFPSQLNRDDWFYMRLAHNAAIDAYKQNEVPVGAVITCGHEVIATAHNQVEFMKDATAHAEILAITQASQKKKDWRLNDCTLYVTKEPCPMCSGAGIMARLGRIVYGATDNKMGFLGGALDISRVQSLNHSLQVTAGILETECQAILAAFFSEKR